MGQEARTAPTQSTLVLAFRTRTLTSVGPWRVGSDHSPRRASAIVIPPWRYHPARHPTVSTNTPLSTSPNEYPSGCASPRHEVHAREGEDRGGGAEAGGGRRRPGLGGGASFWRRESALVCVWGARECQLYLGGGRHGLGGRGSVTGLCIGPRAGSVKGVMGWDEATAFLPSG